MHGGVEHHSRRDPGPGDRTGRVIFMSSRMAMLPLPLASAYGVSKRALAAYADALRLEVGSHVKHERIFAWGSTSQGK